MSCKDCPPPLKSIFLTKLGKCRSCVFSAVLLSMLSWFIFLIPDVSAVVSAASLLGGCLFTAVFLLHAAAWLKSKIF